MMNATLGQTCWVINDKIIPNWKNRNIKSPLASETMSVLNTSAQDAHVEIFVYFNDREPIGPFQVEVPARRLVKVNFNDFITPEPIPYETAFAAVMNSDVPVIVQGGKFDLANQTSLQFDRPQMAG